MKPARRMTVAATTFVLALGTLGAAADPRPRALPTKSLVQSTGPERDLHHLVVKLMDDAPIEARDGKLAPSRADRRLPDGAFFDLGAVEQALREPAATTTDDAVATVEPVFSLPRQVLDVLRRQGERNTGEALADLSQFYEVRLPSSWDGRQVLAALLARPEVENAYGRRRTAGPVDIPPTTPDFNGAVGPGQGYLDAVPGGVGIDAIWQAGIAGLSTTIADIEAGWNLDHEDLDWLAGQNPPVAAVDPAFWGNATPADIDHGTATLGVLAAEDNGYGVTGMTQSPIRVIPLSRNDDPTWSGPDAVLLATLELSPGDVILLEAEIPIGFQRNVPFETDDAEFAVVRQATALGLHVIEPAGNSPNGLDLDLHPAVQLPAGGSKFDLTVRDSGAVLVGGGESALALSPFDGSVLPWHARYPNSNFGSRIDTYSWAQNIVTTGYGPASATIPLCADNSDPLPLTPADPNQEYTYCYNGTSGAGAIVAGAAALLNDVHQKAFGQPFAPRELRNLLRLGTVAVGQTAWIGHQPALGYQMNFILTGGVIRHLIQADRRPQSGGFGASTDLGRAVAGLGDVDGDGTPDFAVGAPRYEVDPGIDGSQINFGRVYIYSGASGTLLYQVDGDAPNDWLGCAVAGVDDLDGDGVPDFIASAPFGPDPQGLSIGYVRVFSGIDGTEVDTIGANTNTSECTPNLTGLGDLDGDGFGDFAIGEPDEDQVRLISGDTRAVIDTIEAPQSFALFGHALADVGDVDGDGTADLLVGSPQAASAGFLHGHAYVYSGASSRLLRTLRARDPGISTPFAEFGYSVAGAGDVDRDGVPDFLVGAPGWSAPGRLHAGRAYLLRGGGRGAIQSFTSIQAGARRGTAVAGLGDFDGNGYLDVAVGQPDDFGGSTSGRAFVFVGPFPATPGTNRTFWNRELFTRFGASLATVGDLTGDGRDDLLIGEPWGAFDSQGRAYVVSDRPVDDPFAGNARLVADLPAIEARDVDGNGFGGGNTSPAASRLILDAGAAWAGAAYEILGDQVGFVSNATGTLDGAGRTEAPILGPILASVLCPGEIGERYPFTAIVTRPAPGGGIESLVSNPVEIEIINEFGGC